MEIASESDYSEKSGSDSEPEKTQPKRKLKQQNGTSKKAKVGNKSDLYKPPTVEELNQLRETENLYNNNLFRLQIKELVDEIQIKNKRKKFLAKLLEQFKTILGNLPEFDEILLSDIKPTKRKTVLGNFVNSLAVHKIPVKTDQDITLKFLKPDKFELFGLNTINSLPGPELLCNINVKIPKSCFLVKDFLNNRYHVKQYYYLVYIAEALKKNLVGCSVEIIQKIWPLIQVTSSECDKVTIGIHATPSEEHFKPSRCLPHQNNVKTHEIFEGFSFEHKADLCDNPTIYYNSALAHDLTLSINWNYIKGILSDEPTIQEGIKLISVWLKQRELKDSCDFLTYIVMYLFEKKRINKHMSSYQIIRNVWTFLANHDLETEPVAVCENISQKVLDEFKQSFDVVLLDKSGCFNVASFLHVGVYKKLRREAALALQHLDDNKINSFQSLFIYRQAFTLQYDLILVIPLSLENFHEVDAVQKAKYIGFEQLLCLQELLKLLRKGLNNRVLNMVPYFTPGNNREVTLGINLNPDEAFNFMELGPALNDFAEAAKFRAFWGNLSSDRRFRDGTTKVAVYFKTRTIKDRRGIIKKILKFLLKDKLKIDYKIYYDEFDDLIVNKKILAPYPLGTNEEASLKVVTISDDLGKKIRGLEGMSLSIIGIQGVSDVFTYTEVFPPIATNYKIGNRLTEIKGNSVVFKDKKILTVPRYVQPVECVLQLEHSSKWPDDLKGVRYLMTSFYLQISKLLFENHNVLSHVSREYVDVFYEGLIFRYRLFLPKEVGLLKKQLDGGVVSYKESAESFQIETKFHILPRVNGALKGLQSQNPSYGPGTALIKRWLRAQLIDESHFPNAVINLLNAALYMNASPFAPSNTPQISFLRFLKFFSDFQWDLQTVLVNFNEEITKEQLYEFESNFQQNRSSFPTLFILMPFDKCKSVFTKTAPSVQVLQRVKTLAVETLNIVTGFVLEKSLPCFKVFIPNWTGYNVLIHLKPLLNPRRHEQIVGGENVSRMELEAYNSEESNKIPIVDFNPVQIYLDELRSNYGEFAIFFHDTFGGLTIGVLWNPKVFQPTDFKVTHVNARRLIDDKLVFNVDAVIEDFYTLGNNLVRMIETQ